MNDPTTRTPTASTPAHAEEQVRFVGRLACPDGTGWAPTLGNAPASLVMPAVETLWRIVTLRPDLIPELIKALEGVQGDRTSPLAAEHT
jgi:hypothetical protein